MEEKRDDTVYLSSQINEIFATTEVTQYFTNKLENPIELKILFPILKKLTLSKFIVKMEDKKIVSKVLAKEKAEEKYNDIIAKGNVGFISNYSDDNKVYSVNIGNLPPKKSIELKSTFIQMLDSNDLSYEFIIMENYPDFNYKELENKNTENKKINAIFNIETQSKITRLIAPFLDKNSKKDCIYNIKYRQDYKKAEIEYKNNKIDFNINNNENDQKTFSILFRTENMIKPILYSQYNSDLKETAYSLNYTYISKNLKEIPIPEKPDEDNTISYTSKYEKSEINDTPGLFIFLIDQSGSMSGERINIVKKALLLFVQSLPKNSYFQLIGFGSDFKQYNHEPVIYNKDNLNNIINIINGLEADMGGTNISSPLREIYSNDDIYSKIELSKNIFILTDGDVFDRNECFDIIRNNSNKFRIHSIGIGNGFDTLLIEQCGKLGKGSSSFVKDIENLNSVVIDVLNKGLRPYISNIKFEFENYKDEISSNIITCNPINNFTYQNEIMNYSFILPGEKDLSNLKIKIIGKAPNNKIEENIIFENIIKLENGDDMSKMIVGKALKNNEDLINDEKKEVEFAKKYQILSKNTALFAEIFNEEKQQSKLIEVNLSNLKEKETFSVDSDLYSRSILSYGLPSNMNNQMNNNPMFNLMQNPNFNLMQQNSNLINQPQVNMMQLNLNPMLQTQMQTNSMTQEQMQQLMHQQMLQQMRYHNKMMCQMSMAQQQMMQQQQQMMKQSQPQMMCQNPITQQQKMQIRQKSFLSGKSIKSYKSNNSKNNSEIDLIMSQDAMEGFWDENEETKKLIDIISLDKFNKIENKIHALNKLENEKKIIYTILVIYYLKTNLAQKLNEFKLVLHKAYKFLKENGIDYDNIVSDI